MIQSFPSLFADADPKLASGGAADTAIRTIERALSCAFPADYRAFLQQSDGGSLDDGRVVFYSVAAAEHDDESLRTANLSQPGDALVVVVGYDEEAEFGFRKADIAQPRQTAAVYVVAEDGELAFGGPSFTEFVKDLSRRVAKARARRALPWWKRLFGARG